MLDAASVPDAEFFVSDKHLLLFLQMLSNGMKT